MGLSVNDAVACMCEALKKQIPMKPLDCKEFYMCAACKMPEMPVDGFNYCPYCGQKIDWKSGGEADGSGG